MQKSRLILLAIAIASLLVLAGCGNDNTTPTAATGGGTAPTTATGGNTAGSDISVGIGAGLKFDKDKLTATAGQTVKITFTNNGSTGPHSFVIDNPKVSIPDQNPQVGLPQGQSGSQSVANLAAGTYTFYCAVPGHKEAGMTGTLEVK